ncbi:MAG: PDZ domain-containing protein, partial [Calditrichaeota bacterium]|nr:PDZ domain-containing protein [Calditrichota bacterium]
LDEIKREALGIDDDIKGIFVDGVQENTPADEEGLRGGEVIIEVDGTPVEDVTGFRFLIADYPPHSKVKMKVWRDGKSKNITFTLAERSEFVNRTDAPQMKSEQLWFGIEVTPTDGVLGRRLGLEDIKGVLVVRIAPESPASGLLEGGDVIVEVGGVQIENVEDYLKAIEKVKDRKKAIPFWIYRNGLRTFVPIRP